MRLGAFGTSTIMFSGPGKGQLGPARDTWGMRAADVGSAICAAPLSSCGGGGQATRGWERRCKARSCPVSALRGLSLESHCSARTPLTGRAALFSGSQGGLAPGMCNGVHRYK